MAGLSPVARMAEPCSVPKYQYITPTIAAARISPTRMERGTLRSESTSAYLSTLTALLADMPMMRRLIE